MRDIRVRLSGQPFEILSILAAHAGDVVSREENPRYKETLAGRGYRFIGTLERAQPVAIPQVTESFVPEQAAGPRRRHLWWWLASIAACFITFALEWQFHSPPAPLR